MEVSAISANRRNLFIEYSNKFMNFKSVKDDNNTVTKPEMAPVNKMEKSMGIETLTIFPKQVIDGKTVITA